MHVPKAADATHLAATMLSLCNEFWTLDDKLLRLDAVIGEISLRLPHIEQMELPLHSME